MSASLSMQSIANYDVTLDGTTVINDSWSVDIQSFDSFESTDSFSSVNPGRRAAAIPSGTVVITITREDGSYTNVYISL